MKKLLVGITWLFLAGCNSSAGSDNTAPIVGHWTFTQLTVDHPGSVIYALAPGLCIGDLDIRGDGTYNGWNVCKRDNAVDRIVESYSGTWTRVSTYHYRANNGDYDVVLNKEGTMGVYGSTTTANPNLVGHYEYGHMFKDVVVDHAELQ